MPRIKAASLLDFYTPPEDESFYANIPSFTDMDFFIPDLWDFTIKPLEWLIPGLVARNTILQTSGPPGAAKSFLALKKAIAVATGGEFLGQPCQQAPVLYVDMENPPHYIKKRLEQMGVTGPLPYLKIWGSWAIEADCLPPPIGHPAYLTLCRQLQPYIIFDHFRNFHTAKENSSDEMMVVLNHLRMYSALGAAVELLHHPRRNGGDGGRGSGEILGAIDVEINQTLAENIITLSCPQKNRTNGSLFTHHIEVDWQTTDLKMTTDAQPKKVSAIRDVIAAHPGISQNELHELIPGKRSALFWLLHQGDGNNWTIRKDGKKNRLYPLSVPFDGEPVGTNGTGMTRLRVPSVPTSPPLGGKEPVTVWDTPGTNGSGNHKETVHPTRCASLTKFES